MLDHKEIQDMTLVTDHFRCRFYDVILSALACISRQKRGQDLSCRNVCGKCIEGAVIARKFEK